MIVLRFRPVSRSVLRIEQPSRRHWIERSPASGLLVMVARVNLVCGSQKVELQDWQRQR